MIEHISREKIHDLLDGLLSAAEEAEIAEHVRSCGVCREELAAMRDVVEALRDLPASAETPETAWEGIAARISGSEPGRDEEVRVVAFPGKDDRRRSFHFTIPQLAAAAVVVSVLSAGVMWTALNGGLQSDRESPVAGTVETGAVQAVSLESPGYAEAVAELEAIVAEGRDRLSPETMATLDRALITIDAALAEVRAALEADPSNQLLGRMLVNHQRSRLRILRQAVTAVQAVS